MSDEQNEKIRVLVCANFNDEIMDELRAISDRLHIEKRYPEVPTPAYQDIEILYTIWNFPEPDHAPHLRWVQLHYAGMENIVDRPIGRMESVQITSCSGIHAVPITEYCIGMMLAWEYRLPEMLKNKEKAHWPKNPYSQFIPQTLRGQTLGIVGYGSIARELARVADQMGMRVLATKRDLRTLTEENAYREPDTGDPDAEIPDRLYPPEAVGAMVTECDFVVVTVPLTRATQYLIDEEILDKMRRDAVLINIARGGVVDEAALVKALQNRKIGGAVLDVFEEEPLPKESPLWGLDNVIITPHVAGNNTQYHERAAAVFGENLRRYLENQPLLNRLDRERGY